MVFSSLVFLFIFLPLTLFINTFISNGKIKNLVLMTASIFFYAWGEMQYTVMMLVSILINFIFGLIIDIAKTKIQSKIAVSTAVAVNLSLLVFFKYANFITDNLNILFGLTGSSPVHLDKIHLPIGISFFTFHSISYLVDIYRKEAKAERSIINLSLYISFFPQLIAGPIIRYHDIADQIIKRTLHSEQFVQGIRRFITGLGKKVLIANTLAHVADQVFAIEPSQLPFTVAWIGILAYSMQIYFDFSGYSDMAIGMAKMFGFEFLENFNYPYIARSIKDFWRRWHISLSNWFRDYLYIPLGGNRGSKWHTYLNLCIVFFLTGLWHGASWNFIVWGLMHGMMLLAERAGFDKFLNKLWKPLQHIYLLLFVSLAWVFFRSDNFTYSIGFIKSLAGLNFHPSERYFPGLFLNNEVLFVFILAFIGSMPVVGWTKNKLMLFLNNFGSASKIFSINLLRMVSYTSLLLVFILSSMSLVSGTYNPFIYFRF